eukprot:PLAT12254.1.p2 GENE.PLAT12254.1~~PLAT12254.1.p2  ORF type:complete len:215 (+),score=104.38 PLAT12254.1:701-1345(+)
MLRVSSLLRSALPATTRAYGVSSSAAVQELVEKIAEEVADEEAAELPSVLAEAAQLPFTVETEDGTTVVELRRRLDGEEIVIRFAADGVVPVDDEEEAVAEHDLDYSVPFTAEIWRDAMETGLQFDCLAYAYLSVRSIRMAVDTDDSEGDASPAPYATDFTDLDVDLQARFVDYLQERGIDDGLSEFIVAFAAAKEQQEYVTLLGDVSSFLAAE